MIALVVGGGGREHALAWKIAQSPLIQRVLVAPGNAGTAHEPGIENVPVEADDVTGLLSLARERQVGLVIVGPEAPLVAGLADNLRDAGLRCFGPSKAAARLEGSKSFSKAFLTRHEIPTARYSVFSDLEAALAYIDATGAPIVVKADGLAAGKGVTVAQSVSEARAAAIDMLAGNAFGAAGHKVVIEECLEGEEVSFIAMADGTNILPMATSQDHKARDDGDRGPNTGGMGAYSPAPIVDEPLHERIMHEIMQPTMRGLAAEGTPYVGFLYAGLMIAPDGSPRVLEFNCRFGDPEAQPIVMRLQSDLVDLCEAALGARLHAAHCQWDPRPAVGVVMAAGGYPGGYAKGLAISGLSEDEGVQRDCKVFHAGTRRRGGQIVTDGGRVLCVTALGDSVALARERAYARISELGWDGAFYRRDIGDRAVLREQQRRRE